MDILLMDFLNHGRHGIHGTVVDGTEAWVLLVWVGGGFCLLGCLVIWSRCGLGLCLGRCGRGRVV